jgi:hypothetical protein
MPSRQQQKGGSHAYQGEEERPANTEHENRILQLLELCLEVDWS